MAVTTSMASAQLRPLTGPGERFVIIAEKHVPDFASRAAQHDLEATFPIENIEALRKSGFMAAPIPQELGGMGLDSMHDLAVGVSRLSRGCSATAIAANMHLAGAWLLARGWDRQRSASSEAAGSVERILAGIGRGELLLSLPASEIGTNLWAPLTEAVRVENGYMINGRKAFASMCEHGDVMLVTLRVRDGSSDRSGVALIPRVTPGVEILPTWDALGMRASGSHEVVFKDCLVPAAIVATTDQVWGTVDHIFCETMASAGFSLAGSFLGIAEAARQLIVESTRSKRKGPNGRGVADRVAIQELIGAIEIDLATARAALDRAGRLADEFFSLYREKPPPEEAAYEFMVNEQTMKWIVQHAAIRIVDTALTASGGSGYFSSNPLSRLYRDVRAGPFMQPFAPYDALEFIGRVALGIEPGSGEHEPTTHG